MIPLASISVISFASSSQNIFSSGVPGLTGSFPSVTSIKIRSSVLLSIISTVIIISLNVLSFYFMTRIAQTLSYMRLKVVYNSP